MLMDNFQLVSIPVYSQAAAMVDSFASSGVESYGDFYFFGVLQFNS